MGVPLNGVDANVINGPGNKHKQLNRNVLNTQKNKT